MEQIFSHSALQSLYEAAWLVVHEGKSKELLREPLEALESMAAVRKSLEGQRVLEAARSIHVDSECDVDIDSATMVYHNDEDGWWVMGWCFVRDSALAAVDECHERF
jgi:hypothetical protein